eukprot:GGOE01024183.1.p2 GENE.GGOE01024183.1~~GGOE01024183.1.p2  ORF type:complete len:153 (+),score=3.27 GGOE01024183.1:63-461(+)
MSTFQLFQLQPSCQVHSLPARAQTLLQPHAQKGSMSERYGVMPAPSTLLNGTPFPPLWLPVSPRTPFPPKPKKKMKKDYHIKPPPLSSAVWCRGGRCHLPRHCAKGLAPPPPQRCMCGRVPTRRTLRAYMPG